MENKIVGDEIKIYEYTQCAIIDNIMDSTTLLMDCVVVESMLSDEDGGSITVQSPKDAVLIIESLSRFVLAHPFFRDEKYKN